MTAPNLVESAIAVVCPEGPLRELVEAINADLGTRYTLRRLYEWRAGSRAIPQPVQDWMLRTSASWAIIQEGGAPPWGDEALDNLAARLCPPPRD